MEHLLGLLRIKVHKGINLAVRDVTTSDPYVIIRMGKQVIFSNLILVILSSFIHLFLDFDATFFFLFNMQVFDVI